MRVKRFFIHHKDLVKSGEFSYLSWAITVFKAIKSKANRRKPNTPQTQEEDDAVA